MKKNSLLIILLFSLFAVSCTENSTSGNSGDSDGGTGFGGGGGGGGGSTGGSSGGSGGSSCLSSGSGNGTPIHELGLFLAGHQSWMPGYYSSSLAQATMPNVEEAGYLFRSDSRLKIKLKVNSQPRPPAGEEYCHGRQTGQASDAYRYTKLRFRISLRDIMCDNPDPSDQTNCLSQFYLGPRYKMQYTDPINVDSCTSVIDIGAKRNQTQYGTVVEVDDVRSDSDCQYGYSEYNCPSEKIVRAASCWSMTMQIVTDFTKDF